MAQRFDVVGFDADDTLWHSEDSFHVVEARFVELLQPYVHAGIDIAAALRATELDQIPVAGYGVKAFTLSMVQAAITVSEGRVPAMVIGQIVEAGMDMLTEPVRLLPDVPEMLADVGRDHRLVLITKGDLVHQTRKVTTSGLAHHFEQVEVVLEKDVDTYARILALLDVAPRAVLHGGQLGAQRHPPRARPRRPRRAHPVSPALGARARRPRRGRRRAGVDQRAAWADAAEA